MVVAPATEAGTVSPWPHRLRRAALVVCWAVVVGLVWLLVSRAVRITRPVVFTVLLQGLTPLAFLPVYVVVGLAVWRRRWVLTAAAALLVAAHLALVIPVLGATSVPAWAAEAPRLTILSANLYDENPTPDAAAKAVVDADVDVLVLVEISRDMQTALDAAGLEQRFPYHERNEFDERAGSVEGIYSRLPILAGSIESIAESGYPRAVVAVGDTSVDVVAVHVSDPRLGVDEWRAELAAVDAFAHRSPRPTVLAGDFNGTRWNPQYADLLGDGVVDAVEERGRGLTFSWPIGRFLPFPVMRLDHALGNRAVAAVANRDVTIPGSDHRGLVTTWAVASGVADAA